MIAVVAGGTGLVGKMLIQVLENEPRITKIKVISRRPLNDLGPKSEVVLVPEISELLRHKDLLKGDLFFSALGTTIKKAGSQAEFRKIDFHAVYDFGKIAEFHEARCLSVVSAAGANSNSFVFYSRVKGEAEEALQSLPLKRLHVFRPGLLRGERSEHRTGEQLAEKGVQLLEKFLPPQFVQRLATSAKHLAQKMVMESFEEKQGLQVYGPQDL